MNTSHSSSLSVLLLILEFSLCVGSIGVHSIAVDRPGRQQILSACLLDIHIMITSRFILHWKLHLSGHMQCCHCFYTCTAIPLWCASFIVRTLLRLRYHKNIYETGLNVLLYQQIICQKTVLANICLSLSLKFMKLFSTSFYKILIGICFFFYSEEKWYASLEIVSQFFTSSVDFFVCVYMHFKLFFFLIFFFCNVHVFNGALLKLFQLTRYHFD